MSAIVANGRYTAREVAEVVLRHSRRWFYEHRAELEKEGFPAPISTIGHARWSGAALLAWEQRQQDSRTTPAPAGASGNVDYTSLLALRSRKLADEARSG